jgi:hypothetical protein
MNTQFKVTLVAAALAAIASSPVLASDQGDHDHKGPAPVTASASAVDLQGIMFNNVSNYGLPNTATVSGDTASGASGNIGVNISAGDTNVQDNAAALASVDSSFVFGSSSSSVGVGQMNAGNQTQNFDVQNKARIGENAFSSASGNIGVNVAAGTGNGQKNTMAASVTSLGNVSASILSAQASGGNMIRNEGCQLENTASIGGSAFSGASGNIGVNITSGTGNLQSNSLSMAVSCTGCTGK